MDKETVVNIFSKNSLEDIECYLSKSKLVEMFIFLFKISPKKSATKRDLVQQIHYYLEDMKRTADLCKILQ